MKTADVIDQCWNAIVAAAVAESKAPALSDQQVLDMDDVADYGVEFLVGPRTNGADLRSIAGPLRPPVDLDEDTGGW